MHHLTIHKGAMCMDGGSVHLEATDATGRPLSVRLDWSITAQRTGSTFLAIDHVRLQPGSAEETEWIEALRVAEIAAPKSASPAPSPPPKRIVLAPDAKAFLDAIGQGPNAALAALRDSLLQKVQSPTHKREAVANLDSSRKGPLPLP